MAIFSGDFDGALAVFTDMALLAQESAGKSLGQKFKSSTCMHSYNKFKRWFVTFLPVIQSNGKPLGAYSEILARCEISRVLLLMLLQVGIKYFLYVLTNVN